VIAHRMRDRKPQGGITGGTLHGPDDPDYYGSTSRATPSSMLVAVVVDIQDCPNAHSDALWRQLQSWTSVTSAIPARVVRVQAKTDCQVATVLAESVLPTVDNPDCVVVVFRGNTTRLLIDDLNEWVYRWLLTDKLVWRAGPTSLKTGHIPKWLDCLVPESRKEPGWAVFSGPARMLRKLVHPYCTAANSVTPGQFLEREAAVDVHSPPLVEVSFSSAVKTSAVQTWLLRAAARRSSWRPLVFSILLNLVLIVLVLVLCVFKGK
jgi:hypothetical protein